MLRLDDTGSSFYDLIRQGHQHLLPHVSSMPASSHVPAMAEVLPHGTTILALKFQQGVVVAGDRMATEGFQVSSRVIEKVYAVDRYSAIAIAGVAGPCLEIAKIFQTELEHYEKLEGETLSLEGKANKLSQIIKGNLPAAMQGFVVIPLFAGHDCSRGEGRIFKYDVTGGCYEEQEFVANGSGGKDARNTLKKLYRRSLDREQGLRLVVEALFDAAEEDVGTGGPDLVREIYPSAKVITAEGVQDVSPDEMKRLFEQHLSARKGQLR